MILENLSALEICIKIWFHHRCLMEGDDGGGEKKNGEKGDVINK